MKAKVVKNSCSGSRKRYARLKCIVSALKRGEKSSEELMAVLRNASNNSPMILSCSLRTLRKDIEILKSEYDAPLEYDFRLNKYSLAKENWGLPEPIILDRDELFALVVAEKMIHDVLPENRWAYISRAVNEIIQNNESCDFLMNNRIGALKILTNTGKCVSDDLFNVIFEAWGSCHCLNIDYQDHKGKHTNRTIEPHALVFNERQWSIKAFCRFEKDWRTFLVNRITSAYPVEDETFIPNEEVIQSISADTFLRFKNHSEVKIRMNMSGKCFAEVHPLRSTQRIEAVNTGGNVFMLYVPDVYEEEVVHWILSHVPGDAVPVAPKSMIVAFRKALTKLMELCPEP